MKTSTRLALIAAVLAITAIAPTQAGAAQRHTVTNSSALQIYGGGVYLFNQAGFYYMGRQADGTSFDRTAYTGVPGGTYTSSYGTVYRWGKSVVNGTCLWIGPPAGTGTNNSFKNPYLSTKSTSVSDGCSNQTRLNLQNRNYFGSDFNCPEHKATGPMTTKLLGSATPFYHSAKWINSYGAVQPMSKIATLAAWSPIQYRYSTKDNIYAVVFAPGYGWGFVPKWSIPPIHTGSYSVAGNFDVAAAKPCDP
ncbi:MAG: hypothetical protein JHD02_09030 [Thermoleophilaceae bacterium]|nr:hypothetical protein [Thermoleophilaceae bacterium]